MPVATDRYLLVHAPKTGGTYCKRVLRHVCGDYQQVGGGHDPYPSVPEQWRGDRSVVGSVRDPWSWYASWYFHTVNGQDSLRRALRVYGGGALGFREVLWGATHPEPGRVPVEVGALYTLGSADELIASGAGLYSYTINTIYDGVDLFVDQGNLSESLAVLLGVDQRTVLQIGPANVGMRRGAGTMKPPHHYREIFDDEMIDWVAQAEIEAIDRFGFVAFGPARRNVIGVP